jgi:ribosomal protein L7Ae-like RNA K-turn-binding protein
MKHFSGSYKKTDVNFLVKLIEVEETSLEEKEKAIQSGEAHYSEMISKEYVPSDNYMTLFDNLTKLNGGMLAEAIVAIANHLNETFEDEITLVSLLRAGTPVGVLLKRTLEERFGRNVSHYSVSIVRDRGIDTNALNHILDTDNRKESGIVFVDGWTAKGVITKELKKYIGEYNDTNKRNVNDTLVVLSDIGGTADITASYEDYAIPSGILNSTVSGLVSRSIWNNQIGENDFHGALYYSDFEAHDKTLEFIDKIMPLALSSKVTSIESDSSRAKAHHKKMMEFVGKLQETHNENDINMIKPGIAEATRVMLRRVPKALYLKDLSRPDVQHLVQLANDKDIPIINIKDMPLNAVAVISNLKNND